MELGAIYLSLDDPGKAAECLDRYLTSNPASYEAYTRLGHCYRAMGMENRARSRYETALRIKPGYEEAVRSLKILGRSDRVVGLSPI